MLLMVREGLNHEFCPLPAVCSADEDKRYIQRPVGEQWRAPPVKGGKGGKGGKKS